MSLLQPPCRPVRCCWGCGAGLFPLALYCALPPQGQSGRWCGRGERGSKVSVWAWLFLGLWRRLFPCRMCMHACARTHTHSHAHTYTRIAGIFLPANVSPLVGHICGPQPWEFSSSHPTRCHLTHLGEPEAMLMLGFSFERTHLGMLRNPFPQQTLGAYAGPDSHLYFAVSASGHHLPSGNSYTRPQCLKALQGA